MGKLPYGSTGRGGGLAKLGELARLRERMLTTQRHDGQERASPPCGSCGCGDPLRLPACRHHQRRMCRGTFRLECGGALLQRTSRRRSLQSGWRALSSSHSGSQPATCDAKQVIISWTPVLFGRTQTRRNSDGTSVRWDYRPCTGNSACPALTRMQIVVTQLDTGQDLTVDAPSFRACLAKASLVPSFSSRCAVYLRGAEAVGHRRKGGHNYQVQNLVSKRPLTDQEGRDLMRRFTVPNVSTPGETAVSSDTYLLVSSWGMSGGWVTTNFSAKGLVGGNTTTPFHVGVVERSIMNASSGADMQTHDYFGYVPMPLALGMLAGYPLREAPSI
jgi:hypothetical protein